MMRCRWNCLEGAPRPGRHPAGPYAVTSVRENGVHHALFMHNLIMGRKWIDHINRDGLDNQRHNLRPATSSQNQQNKVGRLSGSSQYKGLCWLPRRRKWLVTIVLDGRQRRIGEFVSELEAAYAYDQAARDLFGPFAYTNFGDGPTQAIRDQWQAERDAWALTVAGIRGAAAARRWKESQPETRICAVCGEEYRSKSTRSFYCGRTCRMLAFRQRHSQ